MALEHTKAASFDAGKPEPGIPRRGLMPQAAANDLGPSAKTAAEPVHARWPLYVILVGLMLSVVWTGLIAYEAVKLIVWVVS
jgi:hypothetical protein